jgi:hypothetical protein
MADKDIQTYQGRQEEFCKMLKDTLGSDIVINEVRKIHSSSDDWELQIGKTGKREIINRILPAELMTDDANGYERVFEYYIYEIKKRIEE